MKILLINSNPVVSRLTALSARKESVELDEINHISELKNNNYNIVFVDIDSFNEETAKFLKNSNIKKRVCFYTQDNRDRDKIFNFEILKPFLPSEVSAIIRDAKIEMEQEDSFDLDNTEESKDDYLNLDELISTKKDDLEPLNLIEEIDTKEETKDKLLDELNIEKEQIDEIKKENLDLKLDTITPVKKEEPKQEEKIELNKEVEKPTIKEDKIRDNELFIIDDTPSKENDSELFTVDTEKKIDKVENELLNFDLESKNEVNFDNEIKKDNSTKILDKNEIDNIKNLLDSEAPDDLSLDDIIEPPVALAEPKIESKKKKKKKVKKTEESQKEESKVAVDVITDTIKAMPIEELRQLLRGTKINITIEFPNDI
ncbi:MAG TPA: hypothetical protein ENK99_02195 [Campylobacterales bacterium]|nr:hypothetical protein [Campylobacterales bacterium]